MDGPKNRRWPILLVFSVLRLQLNRFAVYFQICAVSQFPGENSACGQGTAYDAPLSASLDSFCFQELMLVGKDDGVFHGGVGYLHGE